MLHLHRAKLKTGHNCCRIPVLLAILLTAVSCFAAETPLPAIASNDNRVPAGKLEPGVLTLNLELRKGVWHPQADKGDVSAAGSEVPCAIETYAFAEKGHEMQVPGPLIRVAQGTELHVSLNNPLPVTIFVRGLEQHPGNIKNVLEIAPGETKDLRFPAGEPGSYMYWATTARDERIDTDGPMAGAFIVDAPGASTDDRIFVIQLWAKNLLHPDMQGALTINGKSWPYTERLQARLGQPEHWRIINASVALHPMHLHGFYFSVDGVGDGETAHIYTPAEKRMVVTEAVPGRHTFDMTWRPERTGNWLFHCHILDHMTSYVAPFVMGPDSPPVAHMHDHHDYDHQTGMSKLVLGITVTGDGPRLVPAKGTLEPPAVQRHLYVRERPARSYVPAGPGFYLDGVSKEVGAVGPPLVITRGERTAVTVTNELDEPTSIHWHGIELESYYDGVPSWDPGAKHATPAIAPGSSFVAYMTPPRAGTFIYHTHSHDVEQLTGGLYGALLVLEPGQTYNPVTDKVFVLGRGGADERHDPLVLNGSPQPSMLVLLTGKTYRFRLINITPNDRLIDTTLTSEGHMTKWRAIAKDGADLPPQQATERDAEQAISVGETYDFEFTPKAAADYELRFSSALGCVVTQMVIVVPPGSPFSVYAMK